MGIVKVKLTCAFVAAHSRIVQTSQWISDIPDNTGLQ